ncbi:hypothetical protein ACLOJK_039133 [Asimina triloba]
MEMGVGRQIGGERHRWQGGVRWVRGIIGDAGRHLPGRSCLIGLLASERSCWRGDGFGSHGSRTKMGKMKLLITLSSLDLEGIRTDRRHHAFARIRSCNQMFAGASITGSHGCQS